MQYVSDDIRETKSQNPLQYAVVQSTASIYSTVAAKHNTLIKKHTLVNS